jgi:hypothetical protein
VIGTNAASTPSLAPEVVAGDGVVRDRFLRVYLPAGLLGLLFVLAAVFVATQADDYGRTWDEGLQNIYGWSVLQWYKSGGTDVGFITQYWSGLHMSEHGPVVETTIAAVQEWTGEQWVTRSVVGGIIGAFGLVGMALCGYELAAWWGALLGATGLALYPRFTGAIFNNTKDIPLTVGVIFILWAGLRLVRRWDGGPRSIWDSALVGLFIGLTASIRINAIFWYGLLGLVAVGWWIRYGRAAVRDGRWAGQLGRQGLAAAAIAVVSYLTMLATWPYVFIYPVSGFIDSFRVMSAYDWDGTVLFDGTIVRAQDLPWQYLPGWLVAGSPPAVIGLGLLGLGVVTADLIRRRIEPAVLLVIGSFAVPIAAIMILGSPIYNGLRHFLFAVPGIILIGVYGLVRSISALTAQRRWALAGVLGVLVLAAQVEVVVSSFDLHPYEYTYFSPVVGGLTGAGDRYEVDYWRSCESEAIRWAIGDAGNPTGPQRVSIGGLFDPITELPRTAYSDEVAPDYFIGSPYATPPPGYQQLHQVSRDGIVLCTVNRRPT